MSRARERRNLDLEEQIQENEATLSQDDSTDIEGEEASMQRGKTSGVSRKSNLNALTGNPSKLGKKQQLSILLSLIHDIRLVYHAALKVPRKHINVPDEWVCRNQVAVDRLLRRCGCLQPDTN